MESEEASEDSTTATSGRRRCHGGWWYPTMPNGGWVVIPILLSTVALVLTIMATFSCDSIKVGVKYEYDYNVYTRGEGKLYCFNNGTCENRNSYFSRCYCPDGFTGYNCQYAEPLIQRQQQQQNLTCLNGGTLVYDEKSKASTCDCNNMTDGMMDTVFAGSQCEYKATSMCDISRFNNYNDHHKDAILYWEYVSDRNINYKSRYHDQYETIGLHCSDYGGFHIENIPDNMEGIGLNETEISAFEAKIDQHVQTPFNQYFQTPVYGILSISIGGMAVILIYLGCWISYSRKVVSCIMAGFLLAGSFLIVMVVKTYNWIDIISSYWIDIFSICMNDTREKLNNGELELEIDLFDICIRGIYWRAGKSERMAIFAAIFWLAYPVWFISRWLVTLARRIYDKAKKDSEAKTAKQKLEAARQLEPEYIDEDEKPPPRPTTTKQKHPAWKKWESEELAAVNSNIDITDKEIAISIVTKDRFAFQYAPDNIRADKDVVLAAVSKNAEMLKFALGGLNQDRDCWLAAGLWKEEQDTTKKGNGINNKTVARIALSTKFSLGEDTHSSVTKFTKCLNDHPYFNGGNFKIYSPNAFSKKTCDPEWTRLDWPCRGTFETCKYDAALKTGPPQLSCCWRYSFRWHLEEAQKTKGFMIQVVDLQGQPGLFEKTIFDYELGRGQQIEAEMATTVGTKIFQIYRPRAITATGGQWLKDFRPVNIDLLASIVEKWYNGGCEDMDVFEIHCEERLGSSGRSEEP